MRAPASELAFASAAILATAIGGIGVPRPASRARTFRPVIVSAMASSTSAGTPLHGSGGSDVYTCRSSSQTPTAQIRPVRTRVRALVGVIGPAPPRWLWWWSCGRVQHGALHPGDPCGAEGGQQVRHRPAAWDLRLRVGVEPGSEDERALVRTGMRQRQSWAVAHLVTVDDEIQVERSRAPPLVTDAAVRVLKAEAPFEHGLRGHGRLRDHHGVQVVGLLRPADRGGLV